MLLTTTKLDGLVSVILYSEGFLTITIKNEFLVAISTPGSAVPSAFKARGRKVETRLELVLLHSALLEGDEANQPLMNERRQPNLSLTAAE